MIPTKTMIVTNAELLWEYVKMQTTMAITFVITDAVQLLPFVMIPIKITFATNAEQLLEFMKIA